MHDHEHMARKTDVGETKTYPNSSISEDNCCGITCVENKGTWAVVVDCTQENETTQQM